MNITIYTKAHCPNCVTAKQLLQSKRLDYTEMSVDNWEVLEYLRDQHPDVRQMPQIFIDNQHVGGLAGLQAALKQLGI